MTIDELIVSYAEHKEEADNLKKIYEAENKEIKKALGDEGEKIAGGYKAKTYIQNKDSLDTDLLVTKLNKTDWAYDKGIIKVKEYIDTNALENALYEGNVPKEVIADIDKCRRSSKTVCLKITKVKEGKDD